MNKKTSQAPVDDDDDDDDWSVDTKTSFPSKGIGQPPTIRSHSLPPTARSQGSDYPPSVAPPSAEMRSPTVLANNKPILTTSKSARGHESLPSHTEVYTVSPTAAGLPILEIIRKLEEEKILSRDDRYELKEILYSENQQRRDEVIKALQEVELNGNSRFSVRRLKAAIYQNGSGEVSSKSTSHPVPQQQVGTSLQQLQDMSIFSDKVDSSLASIPPSSSARHKHDFETSSLSSQSEKMGKKVVAPLDTKAIIQQQQQQHGSEDLAMTSNTSGKSLKSSEKPPKSHRSRATPSPANNNHKEVVATGRIGESDNEDREEREEDPWNVQSTVSKVVGVASSYAGGMHNITTTSKSSAMSSQTPSRAMSVPSSGSSQQSNLSNLSYSSNPANIPRHFNILQKISVRMDELFAKYSPEMLLKQRKLAVLVGSGSYNPLTRMHLRNYFLAKQYLEKHHGYIVLGSLLSPSHPNTVRERYRTNPLEILPAPHRLVIAQLLVNNSQWLTIDPWEITRRRPMDYLALIEHTKYVLQDCYPDLEIQVFYLCKSNTVPTLSPQAIKTLNAQVVTVCRIAEAELLQNSLQSVHNSKQWLHRGLVHIVEDSAILDASLDMVTSRKVREKIKNNESIETLVGAKIQEYVLAHKLGAKLRGMEEWTQEERQLPKIASRPPEPVVPGNPRSNSTSSLSTNSVSGVSVNTSTSQSNNYVPSWNVNSVKA